MSSAGRDGRRSWPPPRPPAAGTATRPRPGSPETPRSCGARRRRGRIAGRARSPREQPRLADAGQAEQLVEPVVRIEGHQIVPVAVEKAVGMHLPALRPSGAPLSVLEGDLPAGLDGFAQRFDDVEIDGRTRTGPEGQPLGLEQRLDVGRHPTASSGRISALILAATSPSRAAASGRFCSSISRAAPSRSAISSGEKATSRSSVPGGMCQRLMRSSPTRSTTWGKLRSSASRMRIAVRRPTPQRSWMSASDSPPRAACMSSASCIRLSAFSYRTMRRPRIPAKIVACEG